eukprot:gene10231-11325_t
MTSFGQVIVGPPGAGKTTYCLGMEMFMKEIGREIAIINLDFANEKLPYHCALDVRDFLSLQEAMDQYELGPNGALLFCMESLLQEIDWLLDRIKALPCKYYIFDFPGQVELYSHHDCVHNLLDKLVKELDCRLCCVQLVDSYYCSQPATFISAVLLVISTMLRLALPHVNILSKIDLLKYYGELPFTLDFFTELPDLMPLVRYVGRHIPTASELEEEEERERQNSQSNTEPEEEVLLSPLERKFAKMTEAICEVVTDFNLVSFLPMNIEDVQTVARVVAHIDRANGFSIAEQYDELESLRVGNRTATDGTSSSRQQTTQPVGSSTSESEKSAKTLFKYASDHVTMESIYDVSFDIQNAQVIEHQHPS